MKHYRYQAAPKFWQSFKKLSSKQKKATEKGWLIFKKDPFDSRLGTHKIHSLSKIYGQTVYSVRIEKDLRSVFILKGSVVYTLDIGTHAIYRG